jgi:hypothetical protein
MVWKIYAVMWTVIVLTSLTVQLSQHPTTFDYIDAFASVISLMGLVAFAFRKAVFTAAFWKSMFVLLVAWDLAYNVVISRVLGLGQRGFVGGGYVSLFGLVLAVPAYVGLFLYAYRRRQLWEQVI